MRWKDTWHASAEFNKKNLSYKEWKNLIIKEYLDRLLAMVNKVRLLGTIFTGSKIVEKIIATVPKRYEASITTLENTKYMSEITSEELLNVMQAQEQWRLMR